MRQTKEEKLRHKIDYLVHKCFYKFMRDQFGYDGDAYPSDCLLDWKWQKTDSSGNYIDRFDYEHCGGIYIEGTKHGEPNKCQTILFSELC